MKKGKIWGLIFLVLTFLTVWAVISQNKSFSFMQFKDTLAEASILWLVFAAASMIGYIIFEGAAILCIIKTFGYRKKIKNGFLYSAADIYFSAITPSATGGQPASAYFMMKDGISGAVVTLSLLVNLIMYTLALLAVGTAGFIIRPQIFNEFHLPGKIFIAIGYIVLCVLVVAFLMLIIKPRILEKICEFFIDLGKKMHIVRNPDKKRKKLYHSMMEYRECADVMIKNKLMFVKAFVFNLLQRLSQITVTLFVYLAINGDAALASKVWFVQSFVTIGTYSVPIPGGVGVADYLLIDGLHSFFSESMSVNLELISRGVSFYVCLIISALTVLMGIIFTVKKRDLK